MFVKNRLLCIHRHPYSVYILYEPRAISVSVCTFHTLFWTQYNAHLLFTYLAINVNGNLNIKNHVARADDGTPINIKCEDYECVSMYREKCDFVGADQKNIYFCFYWRPHKNCMKDRVITVLSVGHSQAHGPVAEVPVPVVKTEKWHLTWLWLLPSKASMAH